VRWFLESKLKLEDGRVTIDESCRYPEGIGSPQGRP